MFVPELRVHEEWIVRFELRDASVSQTATPAASSQGIVGTWQGTLHIPI